MLDKMLEERKITRTYYALVEGIVKPEKGTIQEKIGRDRHHATRRRVSPTGQTATTHFKVIQRYPKQNITLVSCTLDSGRTHQIRVHFSHIHHPLAGDTLYGGKKIFSRQALHAHQIEFIHPISEEKIICKAPFIDTPPFFLIYDKKIRKFYTFISFKRCLDRFLLSKRANQVIKNIFLTNQNIILKLHKIH